MNEKTRVTQEAKTSSDSSKTDSLPSTKKWPRTLAIASSAVIMFLVIFTFPCAVLNMMTSNQDNSKIIVVVAIIVMALLLGADLVALLNLKKVSLEHRYQALIWAAISVPAVLVLVLLVSLSGSMALFFSLLGGPLLTIVAVVATIIVPPHLLTHPISARQTEELVHTVGVLDAVVILLLCMSAFLLFEQQWSIDDYPVSWGEEDTFEDDYASELEIDDENYYYNEGYANGYNRGYDAGYEDGYNRNRGWHEYEDDFDQNSPRFNEPDDLDDSEEKWPLPRTSEV